MRVLSVIVMEKVERASLCRSFISPYCSLTKWPIINHLYLIIMSPQHKHTWSQYVITVKTYLTLMSTHYKRTWSHVTTVQTYLIVMSPQYKHTWLSCHRITNVPDHHVTTVQTLRGNNAVDVCLDLVSSRHRHRSHRHIVISCWKCC